MSKFLAGLSGNTGAVLAGGVMCALLGLGAYISFGMTDLPEGQVASAPQPVVQSTVATSEPAAVTQAPAVQPQNPSFDELRRETDGTTVIAGRAAPMTEVKILLDGAEVATAKTDSTGGFAAIAVLPPKEDAQIVSLSAGSGDEAVASLDEIILAPTARLEREPAPQLPADVQTAAAPEPTVTEQASAVVEEQTEVAVLQSDEEGVRLLQAARPEAMTSVALDTIGYSDVGDVQLTGRAQADTSKVRVYLDNQSVITLPVGADGRWRGDLPDIDEGVYTLRVDEVNGEGTVSSRIETPFKRESAETLAAASAAQEGPVKSITVQTGATLWAIARDRYGDGTLYLRVVEANAGSIRNPDLIYPGQVFDLPN